MRYQKDMNLIMCPESLETGNLAIDGQHSAKN